MPELNRTPTRAGPGHDRPDDRPQTRLLAGLRAVDCSRTFAGGFCAKLLAELGAAVTRCALAGRAPVLDPEARALSPGERAVLAAWLHGDKSEAALDPGDVAERGRLAGLLAGADWVVEDWRPAERATLGWDAWLAGWTETPPPPIDVSVTDFGLSGPLREASATELTRHAWAAQIFPLEGPAGVPAGFPAWQGACVGGLHAALGALLAWHARAQDGAPSSAEPGRAPWLVEHATVEGLASLHQIAVERWHAQGGTEPVAATVPPNSAQPLQPCRDGHIVAALAATTPPELLAALTGDPAFSEDSRLADPARRARHGAAFDERLRRWLGGRTREEAVRAAQALQLPFGRVRTLAEVLAEPHYAARKFWRRISVDGLGPVRLPGLPFRVATDSAPAASARADGRRVQTPARPLKARHGCTDEEVRSWALNGRAPPLHRMERERGGEGRLPLAGLRVLELSAAWAGPMVGRILAEFGAEVARVEWRPPGAAQPARRFREALDRAAHHRGKAALALDLTRAPGWALLRRLASRADALVENFRPGVLEGWGCGYEALAADNPGLILLSLSGFGRGGPLGEWRALGTTIEGEAGWATLAGERAGATGGPPRLHPEALADPVAALNGLLALLAALRQRRLVSRGMHLDLSQAEGALRQIGERVALTSRERGQPGRPPDEHMTPHGVYRCAGDSSWLAVACRDDAEWRGLCSALGWPDWLAAPELATATGRCERREAIDHRLVESLAALALVEAWARLHAQGVTAAPVQDIAALCRWPHLIERGAFICLPTLDGRSVTHLRTPLAIPGIAARHEPAHAYGADTRHILREWLAIEDAEHQALVAQGVIG
jgi:crotonobetainyl-CoA:carnitine CoA-transferase CaiB-like acyl-CoA transferase